MSRTRIIPLITLVTAIGTLPARAADEGKAWTLHDCMAYAVEHSPRSKIQELTNANTDRDHLAAIMNFLPYISGSVGANANFGRSLDPETNTYTAQNNFNNSYSVSGSAIVQRFQSSQQPSHRKNSPAAGCRKHAADQ